MFRCYSYTIIRERINLWLLKLQLLKYNNCNFSRHKLMRFSSFGRKGRVHLNRPEGVEGGSVQSTTGCRGVRISGSNAGYTVFRGNVKGTGYQLHSPVSPSLPLPCANMCHHISTGFYIHKHITNKQKKSNHTPPHS